MLRKLPRYLVEKHQLTGTVTFAVLFALIFLNIVVPFSDTAWFRLGNSQMFLFTAGFVFIAILILVLSRTVMYRVGKSCDFTYLSYTLWCLSEVILICLFYTFVTVEIVGCTDMSRMHVFLKSLAYGIVSLIIPYILSGMYFAIIDKDRTIRLMNCSNVVSDEADTAKEEDKITLFDSSGALRLSVRTANLYYIDSNDNYIKVWYTDSKGELKTYMIRCRLKTIEDSFKGTSLIRCHRKYIVNSDKVKVLRKESEGYFLDLDNMDIPPIMVTKTYMENVLSRFSVSR